MIRFWLPASLLAVESEPADALFAARRHAPGELHFNKDQLDAAWQRCIVHRLDAG